MSLTSSLLLLLLMEELPNNHRLDGAKTLQIMGETTISSTGDRKIFSHLSAWSTVEALLTLFDNLLPLEPRNSVGRFRWGQRWGVESRKKNTMETQKSKKQLLVVWFGHGHSFPDFYCWWQISDVHKEVDGVHPNFLIGCSPDVVALP